MPPFLLHIHRNRELTMNDNTNDIAARLAAPFDPREVRWKPQTVTKDGTRALAIAYIDARAVIDRLDEVLGIDGWTDAYEVLPDGSVVCTLRARIGEQWIIKTDVGAPSEQPDEGDRRKAAFSDALKRAAVKLGVGRYLYRLPAQWVDYDAQKRQFARPPALPAQALPKRPATPPPGLKPAVSAPAAPEPRPAKDKGGKPTAANLPQSGEELRKRLYAYDARLAAEGVCKAGELVKHVVAAGVAAGHDSDLDTWIGPAIALAVDETRTFEARCRKPAGRKDVA